MLDDAHRHLWNRLGAYFGTAEGGSPLQAQMDFSPTLVCDCCGRPGADWAAPMAFEHDSYGQALVNCPSCRIVTSQQPHVLGIERAVRGTPIGMKLQSVAGGMLVVPPAPAQPELMLGGKYLEKPWGSVLQIVPCTGNAQLARLLESPPPPGTVVISLSLRVERYMRFLALSREDYVSIAGDTGQLDIPTRTWPAFRDAYGDLPNKDRTSFRSAVRQVLSGAVSQHADSVADVMAADGRFSTCIENLPIDPFAAAAFLDAVVAFSSQGARDATA
jgi:hypothetical protein